MKKFGTAAILTGGLSRRMGFDKKHLYIDGEKILDRIIRQLSSDFSDIIIIGSHSEDLPNISGVRGIYPDVLDVSASLVGIHTALLYSQSKYVYVIACDMPIYNHDFVCYMKKMLNENPSAVACVTCFEEWVEPFNAFYHVALKDKIHSFLNAGYKSIFKCLEHENTYCIPEPKGREYSPDWAMFSNLNTPQELDAHLQKHRYCSP